MENRIIPFPQSVDNRQPRTDGALALKPVDSISLHLVPTNAVIIDFTVMKEVKSVTKADIDTAIANARDSLLEEEKQERKSKQTYAISLDRAAYKALSQYKHAARDVYQEAKDALDAYTEAQLVTMLGERFHTNLSSYTSRIIDGEIYPDQVDEPMLRMFERGRDYRRHHGSQDTEREDAEIVGFSQIQEALCDPDTAVGTMMVSISPPGKEQSIYKHNFYDVFTLREKKGQRYIETRRYSSALSYEEYTMKASTLDRRFSPFSLPTDAEFLSRPIRIDPTEENLKTPDELHNYFHKEHDAMPLEEFQDIIRLCAMLRVSYYTALAEDPDNDILHAKIFNALLNKADMLRKARQKEGKDHFSARQDSVPVREDISYYGGMPVRSVETGCGLSEGISVDGGGVTALVGSAAWSVSEFGVNSDKYGKLTFNCPHCNHENRRPYNELIRYCQNKSCEKDVSC